MIQWMKKVGIALATVLAIGCLSPNILAQESENSLILVVEAGGKLVIEPEYVYYEPGQTIEEALRASDHTFTGMENGMITAIDGVAGNYTRSDENGGYDLTAQASSVHFFRFSEEGDSKPGTNLQKLMTAMATYREKEDDVRQAAKENYVQAREGFVGVSEELAGTLAVQLQQAMEDYENTLAGETFTITFGDGNKKYTLVDFPGVTITVKNAYGRSWTDDGDGLLAVPKGSYTFWIAQDGLGATGTVEVEADASVTAELPGGIWLNQETFRLSASYTAQNSEEYRFAEAEFSLPEWEERSLTVAVPDTVSGAVYVYAEYDETQLSQAPTLTAIYTMADSGTAMEKTLVFQSENSGAYKVLASGSEGNQVIYRISATEEDGYTYYQDYTVTFDRAPTLQALSLTDQDGTDLAPNVPFASGVQEYAYKVLDTVTAVTVHTQARDGYQVSINGAEADTVAVSGDIQITVTVSAGDYQTTYMLTVYPGKGQTLSFLSDKAVTVEVTNSNGVVMPYTTHKETETQNRYKYTLVPGETYRYIATKDTYYHMTDDFQLEEVSGSTITVDFSQMEDWLEELAFGSKSSKSYKGSIAMTEEFSPETHRYMVELPDTEHLAYLWVTGGQQGLKIQAMYSQLFETALYMGKSIELDLTSGKTSGELLKRFLLQNNPVGNTVTIRLTKDKNTDEIVYYQDYVIEFAKSLSLEALSAAYDGVSAELQSDDGTSGFDPQQRDYSILIPMAAQNLTLDIRRYQENLCYGQTELGYRIYVQDEEVTGSTWVQPLENTMETQTVTIRVENEASPTGTKTYTLQVLKSPPVEVTFQIAPEEALLDLRESQTGSRLQPDENGLWQLSENYSYRYALTQYGYVGRSGELEVTRDENGDLVIRDGEMRYSVTPTTLGGSAQILWTLEKAPVNTSLQTGLTAQWADFRGNSTNNAVTNVSVPYGAEDGTLYWANQLGSGIDADAVGSPILVDGDIITYAGDHIYRVDTITGDIKATGTMDHKSSFSITPPTYAEGMVFVALSGGTVQAFNAVTLESLWIYQDHMGGQPNCPLTVKEGYLYTGFWNSETSEANFVCLSITDEDPSQAGESKAASWYHTVVGGYYWAGAYVAEDYLLVGTDDGSAGYTSQTSRLLLLDNRTGEVLDSWEGLNGDVRSTVVYDAATNACYFTSKGGSFYSVQVSADRKLTNRWTLTLDNGVGGVAMSTCSPVVYGGRAYIGVSGAGQFSAYSGHNITVIDLNSHTVAYRAETQGYPQTSGLLTTAYEASSGCVYVYFFDNMTPGKLRVLRDRPGQTTVDYVTMEDGTATAYALFTPVGDQAQYAICSPVCDEWGTIYFKNDSANLMAFGSSITSLEVTKQPDKTVYAVGETFDPTGMMVTAHYANGKSRDVTAYVTYLETPLTQEDESLVITFPHVRYHNAENGDQMTPGVDTTMPYATIALSFGEAVLGDVNGDGVIDETDAGIILDYEAGSRAVQPSLLTADVSGDGVVDSNDAVLIAQYAAGKITSFPAAEKQDP